MPMIGYVYYPSNGGTVPAEIEGVVKGMASVGTLIGQLAFGFMGDIFGRRIYGFELLIIIVGTINCATAASAVRGVTVLGFLGFWRLFLGVGIGGDYPMSATITSEWSSAGKRGMMLALIFSMQGIGTLVAALVTIIILAIFKEAIYADSANIDYVWRLCIGLGAVPAFATVYLRFTMPESPRYSLNVKCDIKMAEEAIISKEGVIEDAQKNKEGPAKKRNHWIEFRKYFGQWQHLKVLLGTAGSWFLLDISFYGLGLNNTYVLSAIGFTNKPTAYETLFWNAVGQIIIAILGSVPGYYLTVIFIERWGRRTIQIMGFSVCTALFIVLSSAFYPLRDNSIPAFIAIFTLIQLFHNFGPNSTTFIIPGEVFPTKVRASAHGISAASGKAGAIIAAFAFNVLVEVNDTKPNEHAFLPQTLGILAGVMFLGLVVTILWIPESKGKDLDEFEDNEKLFETEEQELQSESSSSQQKDIAKFSVSSLASGSFYNCEKHYYLLSKPRPVNEHTLESSLKNLQLERGNTFEDRLFQKHKSVMVDHTYSTDFKKVLQEAQSGQYIYQLRFTLPEGFYAEVIGDTKAYRMRSFIPDFLYIHEDPMTKIRKILIIDAKSSKGMSDTHQFQVGSYAFFLQYLIKDIRNLEIDRLGGVWLPSDMDKPELFRIDLMLGKIKLFYTEEIISILQREDPEWHLAKRCATCPFLAQCKNDSKGTIRSLPYMNQEKWTTIREGSPGDIEDLSDLLQNLNLDDTNSRDRTGVKQYLESYQDQEPRFLGRATVLTAREVDHIIYLFFCVDTYSQKPFAYSLNISSSEEMNTSKTYMDYVRASYKELEQDDCPAYCNFVDSFVSCLTEVLQWMDEDESRCLFYVYSDKEKEAIYKFMYNLVASEGRYLTSLEKTRVQEIIENAMRCLVVLFQDTQLLGLPGVVVFPGMEDIQKTSTVRRFVSLEHLLEENIALPIAGFYELPEVARWMSRGFKSGTHDIRNLYIDKIHSCWHKGQYDDLNHKSKDQSIERCFRERHLCFNEIIDTYWELADEHMEAYNVELFPLACKPFKWPDVLPFNHTVLAKLVFFKQLECISACDSHRKDRIADLAMLEGYKSYQSSSSLILQFISEHRISQFEVNIQFKVIGTGDGGDYHERLDRLVMNDWQQYILVADNRESIIKTIKFSDLFYMSTTKYQKKPIPCVNVVDINVEKGILTLNKQGTLGRPAGSYRLYKRYIDFTTQKTIDALTRMDREGDYEDTIANPNGWAKKNVIDEINFKASLTAKKLRDAFAMSPSQKAITDRIFKKRLQIVWGPPGSGKTEFLALFINWYIKCFIDHNGSKDLLIGITAFTNDAIINLLKRIELIQKRHGFEDLFSILFVTYQKDPQSSESDITYVKWQESITAVNKLKKNHGIRIFVMGTTVYSWNNIKDKWKTFKGCEMMIVDESSQLLVSDALLAIACLSRPHGKLIIAGDHMQLGPILANDYSQVAKTVQDPLLYGSIQQCLMRTENNCAISTSSFILEKASANQFGPNTLQLKDNWRMNKELNEFFQKVYGPDFISRYPKLTLHLNSEAIKNNLVRSILDPSHAFSLVNVKIPEDRMHHVLEEEANIVHLLVNSYLKSLKKGLDSRLVPASKSMDAPKVMVVAPYVKQCVAIKRKLSGLSETVPVGTVDKMQGQECDLVIACYTCKLNSYQSKFLIDFRRWNVTLSRARCKVIILAVDNLFNRNVNSGSLESFSNPNNEPVDGWSLLCLLKQWAMERNCSFTWDIEK
ncbi:hypothetical protein G6F23_005167 [Rhizopus arrhizus]|nr:hypothetical protein G6F23_005167 [Rhizopus arrhizus]